MEAEFGVPASLMVDYQILVGDQVDNVPGVHKVGPKTAVKWLIEYGSLQAIVDNAANIKGAVGENLRQALDWLPTGRQLLTIKTDCDLNGWVPDMPSLEAIRMGEPQAEPCGVLRDLRVQGPGQGPGRWRRRAGACPQSPRRPVPPARRACLTRLEGSGCRGGE